MKNWKISLRITVGFTALIVTTIALGLFALNRVGSIGKSTTQLGSGYFPSVLTLSAVQSDMYHQLADLLELCASKDPDAVKRLNNEVLALQESNKKNLALYESIPSTPQDQALYEELKTTRAAYLTEFSEVLKVGRSTDPAAISKSHEMFEQQLRPLFEKYSGLLETLVDRTRPQPVPE